MRPRSFVAALALALLSAAPAGAQDPAPSPTPAPTSTPAPEQRIAPGVRAGGVDLSNLLVEEAAAKLRAELGDDVRRPLVVAVAGKRFTLRVRRADFAFDSLRTAKRAYYAGENNPPAQPEGGGAAAQLDVPLAVTFRRVPIRDFARSVRRRAYHPARNATVRIGLRRIRTRPAREGRVVPVRALRRALESAISDPALPRLIKPGRRPVPAAVQEKDLARRYGTVVTVSRSEFKLRLFKRLRLVKTYGVAVGAVGYPTPTGLFRISNKAVNPVWNAPNSPWAGEFAGRSIPPGPSNPLRARWLGIVNGVGIHGTSQPWSIGTRASHGCIRMRVPDVIDLYPRVPVGSPVLIR